MSTLDFLLDCSRTLPDFSSISSNPSSEDDSVLLICSFVLSNGCKDTRHGFKTGPEKIQLVLGVKIQTLFTFSFTFVIFFVFFLDGLIQDSFVQVQLPEDQFWTQHLFTLVTQILKTSKLFKTI